jgi:UDP-N-acetylmuramyl tripeptide synthase
VTVDHGTVVLAGPDGTLALAPVEVLNLADLSGAHLDNKLAALGAAWALGVAPELMRAALVTLNHGA